jgi:hypothetical protein
MKSKTSSLLIKSREVWSFRLRVKELKDPRSYTLKEK